MHIPPPSLFHLISSCDEISAFRRAVRILTERRFEVFQPRPNARAVALLVPLWAGFYDKGLSFGLRAEAIPIPEERSFVQGTPILIAISPGI